MTKPAIDTFVAPVNGNESSKDWMDNQSTEMIAYRRALARASNAIEGVVLEEKDKHFMDNLPQRSID